VLDNFEHRLRYCNAGHNPPLLVRADQRCEELNAGGAVLGQFPAWSYQDREVAMGNGDKLLLFTDGLVEAGNGNQEAFGEENLIRVARESCHCSAEALMKRLIRSASEHCGGNFQDDASLIVLKAMR
jgi:sigma-B regulation protein RsbU (phosphoserine phosphatase)